MTQISAHSSGESGGAHARDLRKDLQRLDHQQWGLWSATVAVILLLTIGVASFAFPGILSQQGDQYYSFYLNQAVRGLLGMVLLFTVYLIYQQTQISRLRRQLAEQIESIAKVEDLATEVYKLAALDQLTGLYNRRSGDQRLEQEIGRAQRHGRPLTVLLLDLDGLKLVNDKHGHAAGDAMLKGFAERVQKAIRGSDVAIRLGGDEFMVVLPECRAEEVRHVLGRIEGLSVEASGGEKIPCRFSRGWTDYKLGETAHELIKRADDLLYANKREGKRPNSELPRSILPQAVL